jgi:PUA domain protein
VKRYRLRKSQIRELRERVWRELGKEVEGEVEVVEEEGRKLILVDGSVLLLEEGGRLLPFLGRAGEWGLKRVVVDMGAVPHVAGGADVMSPGVVRVEGEVRPGELVAVVDERHGKILAVGEALVPGGEMVGRRGKAVRNLHHVGDRSWRLAEEALKKG